MNNFDVQIISQGTFLDCTMGATYEVYTATVRLSEDARRAYREVFSPADSWPRTRFFPDWDCDRFRAEVAKAIGYDWDPAFGSFAIQRIVSEVFGICAIREV